MEKLERVLKLMLFGEEGKRPKLRFGTRRVPGLHDSSYIVEGGGGWGPAGAGSTPIPGVATQAWATGGLLTGHYALGSRPFPIFPRPSTSSRLERG